MQVLVLVRVLARVMRMSKPSFDDAPSPQPGTDPAGAGHSSGAGAASGAATGADNSSGSQAVSGAAADDAAAGQGARVGDNFQSEHTTRAQRIIQSQLVKFVLVGGCLLYTSDAADDTR